MTATQLKAIIAHGETLQAIFPKTRKMDPVRLCKQLRRLEARAHRLTTAECNGENAPGVFTVECNDIRHKLNNLLGYVAAGVPVFINGDARGYALKIESEWMQEQVQSTYLNTATGWKTKWKFGHGEAVFNMHRDWGGFGCLAPDIGRDGH